MKGATALLALATAACTGRPPAQVTPQTPALADLPALAGATRARVQARLGAPLYPVVTDSQTVLYRDGVNIRFRDGRASWMQVTTLYRYRFGPEVLMVLGVRPVPSPTQRGHNLLRWNDHAVPPFAVVTLHANPRHPERADYANFYVMPKPVDAPF